MKRIKIGILGVSGHFIKRIVMPMHNSRYCTPYAIASRSLGKAQKAAQDFNIPHTFESYEELLADPNIDAVYIPLPNHLHSEFIKKAVDAGKPILCEKPLSMSAAEAIRDVQYARAHNVKLMEAFMYKFHPQWQHVKMLIKTNQIGAVQYIHSTFSYNNPNEGNIRNILDYGGGGLMDIGCYAISASRFILDREPKRVISLLQKHDTFQTDMLSSAILDFGSARATFTVSTLADPFQRVEIVGNAGSIVVHLPFNTYYDVPAEITVRTSIGERKITFDAVDQYQLMIDAFCNSIINNHPVPTDPYDAIDNMKVLDAIFRSDYSNKWETI